MHTDVACLTESSKFFDDSYNELGNCINLLNNAIVQILLHGIIIINTAFLLSGEKYYNENVGAE